MFSSLRPKAVAAARFLGASSALGRIRNHGPVVLYYHGVEKEIIDPRVQHLQMPLARFEKEAAYVKSRFEVITLEHLAQGLRGRVKLHKRQAVISLDDGYTNVFYNAAPVLFSLGLPFTLFISTRHIGEQRRWPTYYLRACLYHGGLDELNLPSLGVRLDISSTTALRASSRLLYKALERSPQERAKRLVGELRAALPSALWAELDQKFSSDAPLTWEQVDELKGMGATIGSHCHDHFPLHQAQDQEEVDGQLDQSRRIIQERYGQCLFLSFPRGRESDISPQAADRCQALGYELAFSTLPGEVAPGASPYLLPRLHSPDHQSLELGGFKYMLNIRFRYMDEYWAACARIMEKPCPARAS